MIRAIYSKKNKLHFLEMALSEAGVEKQKVLFLHPKNASPLIEGLNSFFYEDIGKKKTWLEINGLIEANKVDCFVMDNPSRYPKVEAKKVVRLQKLATMIEHRIVLDIVPFTMDIKYIYTPYSYLDRGIIGFAHFYAFRENYGELDSQGRIRYAHDFDLIAEKINPYCELHYDHFFASNRETIVFEHTEAETLLYMEEREKIVEEDRKLTVGITILADIIHDFESRKQIVLGLINNLVGNTRIVFNLNSYAKKFGSRCKKLGYNNVESVSYALGSGLDYQNIDNLIYMEYPIQKKYLLLDIEAQLRSDCRVFHVKSDAIVDIFLCNKFEQEKNQIVGFIQELQQLKNQQDLKKSVFKQLKLF